MRAIATFLAVIYTLIFLGAMQWGSDDLIGAVGGNICGLFIVTSFMLFRED